MSLPWETHYAGCSRRHPAVAYPRRVCEECRAFERGVQAARDAVDGLDKYHHGQIAAADALAAIDALKGEQA